MTKFHARLVVKNINRYPGAWLKSWDKKCSVSMLYSCVLLIVILATMIKTWNWLVPSKFVKITSLEVNSNNSGCSSLVLHDSLSLTCYTFSLHVLPYLIVYN